MQEETLLKGNQITEKIKLLSNHKEKVLQITCDLKPSEIKIKLENYNCRDVELFDDLFFVTKERQMQFYIDSIDKKVKELQEELDAL